MKNKFVLGLMISTFFFQISCKQNAADEISESEVKEAEIASAVSGKFPVVEFDKTMHDFGYINEGDKVSTEFIVTNKGEADLVIISANGSCGCTVPEFEKNPIKPGASTPIKVTFDSNGKVGQQEKSVTLTTNTELGKETCSIKANVKPASGKPVVKH